MGVADGNCENLVRKRTVTIMTLIILSSRENGASGYVEAIGNVMMMMVTGTFFSSREVRAVVRVSVEVASPVTRITVVT